MVRRLTHIPDSIPTGYNYCIYFLSYGHIVFVYFNFDG